MRLKFSKFVFVVATSLSIIATSAFGANAWHIPDDNTDIDSNAGSGTPNYVNMRNPEMEISDNPSSPTQVTIYQGILKYNGSTQIANQIGGTLYYKGLSQGVWSSVSLTFHENGPNASNQYWKATFSTASIGADDPIQYYIFVSTDGVNYNGANENSSGFLYAPAGLGDHASAFINGSDSAGDPGKSAASTYPFTIRNRPAWIFHANNRVVSGTTVQFWAKVGYIGNTASLATEWATNGAIYYTTDGSAPVPGTTPGTAGNGSTTQVVTFSYDHADNSNGQNGGTQSIAGTAMWWVATVNNLPTYTTINYQVGFWNPANNEQKFGDYNAGDATYLGHVPPFSFSLGTLGSPVLTITSVNNGTLNGDYTTSHVFVDENNGDFIPLSIVFQPNTQNVDPATVQVYTNLNRRDYATLPYVDSFGIATEEGINPPSGDVVGTNGNHYYEAYPMNTTDNVNYTLTLNAQKTGAYRLTARYKTKDPNTGVESGWIYYTSVITGIRDHCVVVSPTQSRNIELYELDTLNINAKGSAQVGDSDAAAQRGTFEDLIPVPGPTPTRAGGAAIADLNYIKNLGCNWLWFQPIHPNGIVGREADPNNSPNLYVVGSPYSVKNFFEVMPLMSASFSGSDTPPGSNDTTSANDTAAGRVQARQSFKNFVAAADSAGISVMLDATFNHSAWDAEFGPTSIPQGITNPYDLIDPNTNMAEQPPDQIWNYEARFFSLSGDYAQRASSAANIALAPDRGDFGKWPDVHDIYFGTYSALVDVNPNHNGYYTNEGDQFFGYFGNAAYPNGDPNWTSTDFTLNGNNYNITRGVWKYFAQYVPYWLSQTGHVDSNGNLVGNSTATSGNYATRTALDSLGIDGLRADFGQGLPPQCWEYIINVARSYKWNFVFMTESLDGGAVTYRSARHFDILNENIIFSFQSGSASTNPSTSDYRSMFDQRRTAYGQGLVLLNNMSHDEQAYSDPFQALIRFGVGSTIDGAPMIFYGQENGISGPIGGTSGNSYGFDHYELNFGKDIANFKLFNGLGPALSNQVNQVAGAQFLIPSFAAINEGRQFSTALRSSNRYYLNQTDGSIQQNIFSIAKYQTANVSPGLSDVILGFVNLDRNDTQAGNYNVNITMNGSNLFGINPSRTYNVKNIAAYTGADPNRRNYWLWNGSNGYSGTTLLNNGVYVSLNPIPATNGGWTTAPYEAQYLKLYDISAPGTPSPSAQITNIYSYAIGNSVTFSWAADPNVYPSYTVTVTVNGGTPFTVVITGTSYTYTGNYGDVVTITVTATNQDSLAQSGASSGVTVTLLDPNGDPDGDGMTNAQEDTAGTNPLDPTSVFRITNITRPTASTVSVTWNSVSGKQYQVETASAPNGTYTSTGNQITAGGATTSETVSGSGSGFYHVKIVP